MDDLIYKPSDFDFLPEGERVIAADGFNAGLKAACHTTENGGSWKVPPYDEEMGESLFNASIKALVVDGDA